MLAAPYRWVRDRPDPGKGLGLVGIAGTDHARVDADASRIDGNLEAGRPEVNAQRQAGEIGLHPFLEPDLGAAHPRLELHARLALGDRSADGAAVVATQRGRRKLDAQSAGANEEIGERVAIGTRPTAAVGVLVLCSHALETGDDLGNLLGRAGLDAVKRDVIDLDIGRERLLLAGERRGVRVTDPLVASKAAVDALDLLDARAARLASATLHGGLDRCAGRAGLLATIHEWRATSRKEPGISPLKTAT